MQFDFPNPYFFLIKYLPFLLLVNSSLIHLFDFGLLLEIDYGYGQYRGNNPHIQFSTSKRGGRLLWLDGMKFFRNNTNRKNYYWRCHWYYLSRCPVLISMNKNNSNDFRQIHTHCHIRSKRKQKASASTPKVTPKIKTPVVSSVRSLPQSMAHLFNF